MLKRLIAILVPMTLLLTSCNIGDWTNRLPYAGPAEVGIPKGEYLPGTEIKYLGKTSDGAELSIAGKRALKKIGDSVEWKADMLPRVSVDQTYRVILITEDVLHVAGTARVIVANAIPEAAEVDETAPVHFRFPVGYHVQKDTAIPGTPIIYLGKAEQGAQLGNVTDYSYRRVGDSIVWKGKLRDRLWIEVDLRTALISEDTLDVLGTAELWIDPR